MVLYLGFIVEFSTFDIRIRALAGLGLLITAFILLYICGGKGRMQGDGEGCEGKYIF